MPENKESGVPAESSKRQCSKCGAILSSDMQLCWNCQPAKSGALPDPKNWLIAKRGYSGKDTIVSSLDVLAADCESYAREVLKHAPLLDKPCSDCGKLAWEHYCWHPPLEGEVHRYQPIGKAEAELKEHAPRPQADWSSVKERLPDHGKIVRVWDDAWKTSYDCQYIGGTVHSGMHDADGADGSSWCAAVDREPDYRITYWMSIPEPPKEKK
jgi:hypothetical protein